MSASLEAEVLDSPVEVSDDRDTLDMLETTAGLCGELLEPLGASGGGIEVEADVVRLGPQRRVGWTQDHRLTDVDRSRQGLRGPDERVQTCRERPPYRPVVPVDGAAWNQFLDGGDAPSQGLRTTQRSWSGKPERCQIRLHVLDGGQTAHVHVPAVDLNDYFGPIDEVQPGYDTDSWMVEHPFFHRRQLVGDEPDDGVGDIVGVAEPKMARSTPGFHVSAALRTSDARSTTDPSSQFVSQGTVLASLPTAPFQLKPAPRPNPRYVLARVS